MAYFNKDKNILHIGESENKYYTYDINTGILIGLRGEQISRVPSVFKLLKKDTNIPLYYQNIISCIIYSSINKPSDLALFIDKYYAMPNHIPTEYRTLQYLCRVTDHEEFFKKHFAKYIEYCTKYNREVSSNSYQDYLKNERLSVYRKYLIYNDELTTLQKELICERLFSIKTVAPQLQRLVAKIMSHPNSWD